MDSRELLIGDIILVHGSWTSLADDVVMLGEALLDHKPLLSNYVHAAIYMGGGQIAEAQYGRDVGYADISVYAGHYDVGHLHLTPDEQARVHARALQDFGKGYDLDLDVEIGIKALTGIDLEHTEQSKLICSEYVYNVIHEATGKLSREKPTCMPEDLALDKDVDVERC